MANLYEVCKKTIDKYKMFEDATKVCVAFSGGSDSSALLYFMTDFCKEHNIVLEAIHINHGIRGDNATRDEQFCIDICKKLGIYITHLTFDIPTLAKEWGMGEEETGRKVRYAAFEQVMLERSIDKICTAHHANDNAETVIFNLSRGAGIKGLSGIPPVRGKIVRPFIECTKEQINDYIEHNSIDYVDDETNLEDDYSRNFIRHNIIPNISQINDKAITNVSRASNLLREDDEYIYSVAEWYKDATLSILRTLPNPILSRVLILLTGQSHINLDIAMDAIRKADDTKVSVGGGLLMVLEDNKLYFIADQREKKTVEFIYELSYGLNNILEVDTTIYVGDSPYQGEMESIYSINCTPNGTLIARSRKEGDKLLWHGMNRQIKNLYQQCGVSSQNRDDKIFICDDDGILCIPGVAQRDKLTSGDIFIQVLRKGSK